jgi:hypothetical protein
VDDVPNFETDFRIISKANTCFQGSTLEVWGRDPISGVEGWFFWGNLHGSSLLDDPKNYASIRSVASKLSVACATRAATNLDVNGTMSGAVLETIPGDMSRLKLN